MRQKHILILALILVTLVGGLFIRSQFESGYLARLLMKPIPMNFEAHDVYRVQIGRGDRVMVDLIEVGEDYWVMHSFGSADASGQVIQAFLGSLHGMRGDIRAEGEDFYEDFKIRPEEAIYIDLFKKTGGTSKLYLGNKRLNQNTSFVRWDSSEKIYLTDAPIVEKMGIRNPETETPGQIPWVSPIFFKLYAPKLQKLSIQKLRGNQEPYQKTHILRRQAGFEFARATIPFKINPDKVEEFILRSQEWLPEEMIGFDAVKKAFLKTAWRIDVAHEGAPPLNVFFSEPQGDKVYVTTNHAPVAYVMNAFQAQNYLVSDNYFFQDDIYEIGKHEVEKVVASVDGQVKDILPEDKRMDKILGVLKKLRVRDIRVVVDTWMPMEFPGKTYLRIFFKGQEQPRELHIGERFSNRDEFKARRRAPFRNFLLPEVQVQELLSAIQAT